MISEMKKLIVVSVAMLLLVCAASTSRDLTWRAYPMQQTLPTR